MLGLSSLRRATSDLAAGARHQRWLAGIAAQRWRRGAHHAHTPL